ncbi:MAG: hypothetical protein AAFP02_07770, partial [Bacteroidota bacterium]
MTKLLYTGLIGLTIGVLIWGKPLQAQDLTSVEEFSLRTPEGDTIKLSDFQDQKAVVVVFTSSH